jgi:hypothetical protein
VCAIYIPYIENNSLSVISIVIILTVLLLLVIISSSFVTCVYAVHNKYLISVSKDLLTIVSFLMIRLILGISVMTNNR